MVKELKTVCDIADTQPHSQHIRRDIKTNLIIFLRTSENLEQIPAPVEQLLNDKFIPTLFDSDTPLDHIVRDLVSLKSCDGRFGN